MVRLHEQVTETALGRPHLVTVAFRDHPVPPLEFLRHGGDPFHDLAVHDIDYILKLLGEQPRTITAVATSCLPQLREAGVYDTAVLQLVFPSGTIATIDMSRLSNYGYDNRIEVFNHHGRIQTENTPAMALRTFDDKGVRTPIYEWSFPERFRAAFAAEVSHLYSVVKKGAAPLVTSWDSLAAQAVADAAQRACALGQPVVFQRVLPRDKRLRLRFVGAGGFGTFMLDTLRAHDVLAPTLDILSPFTRSSGMDFSGDVASEAAPVDAVY
eukprot:UC1_evm1s665